MSEDTGTSITNPSGQEPLYTTSVTSTIGRPPRKVYFAVQLIAMLATLGVFLIHRGMGSEIDKANLDSPALTTLMMQVGHLLTTPIGLACAIFIVLGLGLLAIRGAIDGILKFLIWANVLWLVAFLAYNTMAIWLPLIKGRPAPGP
ncbi:MAG: hypothetical protein HY293_04890 [Planctomycetes bacterium]|nr:hypothetical protein [Planctomycetota bacterium]